MTGPNPQSILDCVKKALGIDPDYAAFDLDIVMHTNTAFSVLTQLGVGPVEGFAIEDDTELWSSYSADLVLLAGVKSYIYLKVRLLFDPPATSFTIAAMENLVKEMEWRLNVAAEAINKPVSPVDDTTSPYATSGG
jgi:hypothetical protein